MLCCFQLFPPCSNASNLTRDGRRCVVPGGGSPRVQSRCTTWCCRLALAVLFLLSGPSLGCRAYDGVRATGQAHSLAPGSMRAPETGQRRSSAKKQRRLNAATPQAIDDMELWRKQCLEGMELACRHIRPPVIRRRTPKQVAIDAANARYAEQLFSPNSGKRREREAERKKVIGKE